MKSNRIGLLLLVFIFVLSCGGGGGESSAPSGGGTPTPTSNNVLPIAVNGPAGNAYLNEPTVSVTVCAPGTLDCQTIDGILLDTGSYGLRVFKDVLSVPLPQVTVGSASLAECIRFADGSSEWGPVQMAGVILGGEPAVQVPIHVVDAIFGNPHLCGTPDQSPSEAGYNGILGVGLFVEDCGPACANSPNNGRYFACSGTDCTGTTVPLTSQVQNPVAFLPQDNNGVVVELPAIPREGVPSAEGSLILGIGTQPNNSPSSGVAVVATNQRGVFTTILQGIFYTAFIDTGSNGLFFEPPSAVADQLPNCTGFISPWFCPPATLDLVATDISASGSSVQVPFAIGNFSDLIASGNQVFNDIGASAPAGVFTWGLPFFFGRTVFVGLEGTSSPLGTGPYFAF